EPGMETQDRIEREITIEAPLERVWELVSEPGWWISDGDPSGHRHWPEGEFEIVEDPKHGRWPVRVLALEPMRYASFRWTFIVHGGYPAEGNATLVEFFLSERNGATVLRVLESGFATLALSEDERQRQWQGNVDGWKQQ